MFAHFYHFHPKNQKVCPQRLRWLHAIAAFFVSSILFSSYANAAWQLPLNDTQRRDYLKYYAPVIFKMADEDSKTTSGRDWITNFDFDRDGMFSTNRKKWETELQGYTGGTKKVPEWYIRPTLYTALLEFQETVDSPKSVVLLYHVYHAMEEDEIHDWERVEIRIDNVTGSPGSVGETFAYVVATQHSTHVARRPPNVQFMTAATGGKHPMILQGPWSGEDGIHKNELRHVVTPWATIASAVKKCRDGLGCNGAVVDVSNGAGSATSKDVRVNYVFVPGSETEGGKYWGALNLTKDMAAKTNKVVPWNKIVPLTYELQDIADIMQTHAVVEACGSFATEHEWKYHGDHWIGKSVQIKMDNNIYAEPGNPGITLVPTTASCNNKKITYYLNANDSGKPDTKAQGYPYKHWFWGAYITGVEKGSYTDEAFDGDLFYASKSAKGMARPCAGGYKSFWCQHDYYAHKGLNGNDSDNDLLIEPGMWLPADWYTPEKGGFDGRWVQLFSDRYEVQPPPPPRK